MFKKSLNLGKRSRHSALLRALNVPPVSERIADNTLSLFYRICQADTPTRDVVLYMLSDYIINGRLVPGTLVSRVVEAGVSPMSAAMNRVSLVPFVQENGVVDSIRGVITSENFIKPHNVEGHKLLRLLTRSF